MFWIFNCICFKGKRSSISFPVWQIYAPFFSLITCFEKQFEPAVSIFRKNNHEKAQAFSFIFWPLLKICVVVVQQQNNLFISHPVSLSPLCVSLFPFSTPFNPLLCLSFLIKWKETDEEVRGQQRGSRWEEEESRRYLKRRWQHLEWSGEVSFFVCCFFLSTAVINWKENKLILLTLENKGVWHVSVFLSFLSGCFVYWIVWVDALTCDCSVFRPCIGSYLWKLWHSRLERWLMWQTLNTESTEQVLCVKWVGKSPQIQSFQVLVTSLSVMVTTHAAFQRNIDKDTHLFLVHFCYSCRFETQSHSVSWGEQFWIIIAGIWMAQTMNTADL